MFVRRGTGDYVSTTAPASDPAHWYAFTVQQGPQGVPGTNGADGASAYQIALQQGFVGTEAQWLASLKGADGAPGQDGQDGAPGLPGPAGTVTAPNTAATDRALTVFGVWENGTWRNLPYATLRDWLAEDIGGTEPEDTSSSSVQSSSGTGSSSGGSSLSANAMTMDGEVMTMDGAIMELA